MSKCFEEIMEILDEVGETRKYEINDNSFFTKFESPEQYVNSKIRILEDDMYIQLTEEEIAHLKSLKTESTIDAAVRAIINAHWN